MGRRKDRSYLSENTEHIKILSSMGFWQLCAVLVVFCASASFAVDSNSLAEGVKFEALKSGGFRAYIAGHPELTSFKLDGKINSGRIFGHTKAATDGFWVIQFNEVVKVGDVFKYTMDIDADRLRYKKTDQTWEVTESDLHDTYPPLLTCKPSTTIVNGEKSCVGKAIILDEFKGSSINRTNWIVEHRIPTYEGVNAEFNSYEDSGDTRFLKDGTLYIKPIARQNQDEVRGRIDLTNGCTSTDYKQCYYQQQGAFLLPPVKSARLTSKVSFKYGKVEIMAKLPAGEWIVPVIQLEPKGDNYVEFSPKILIAYSRGNNHLTGNAGGDIGSHLLYAGPVLSPSLPEENQILLKRSAVGNKPYCSDFHVYTLEWLPDTMLFYVDDHLLGSIDSSHDVSAFDQEYSLSIGVAVGGINDFPDDCISGSNPRPWDYNDRNYLKTFFDARTVWSRTWTGDNCALQIQHVKVWAVE